MKKIMNNEFHPTIIIDERERGKIRSEFENFPLKFQIETLPVADYIISEDIGIERKRGDDLISSICDNRLFIQLNNLKKSFKKPLIILENPNLLFTRSGVLESSIYGAIMYVIYKLDIPIITVLSEYESAQTIWSFSKYVQKLVEKPFQYKAINIKENVIDFQSQIFFLEGLFNTSQKKAKLLLDKFETPWKILNAILDSEINQSRSGKINDIVGSFKNIRGFGPKYLIQNKKILETEFTYTD